MDSFDLVIIGAGPGGYVAAIRAAQLGLKVGLVEKNHSLGGTCLNVGCIPSKVLLESSELFFAARHKFADHGIKVGEVTIDLPALMKRKDRIVNELTAGIALLMKKNKVTVLKGQGKLLAKDRVQVSANGSTTEITARNILLATGSAPMALPFLPFDDQHVVNSTGALSFPAVPQHLAVIGAGAVGLELGCVWQRLGAKVTIIEMLPQITPFADGQMAKTLLRALKGQGLEFRLQTQVAGAQKEGENINLQLKATNGEIENLSCDRVLVAIGRRPYSEGLGLEQVELTLDAKGNVPVNEHFATQIPGIYAIGDLIQGPMLAHKAEEEGVAVAEIIAGKPGHMDYNTIPNIVYTSPELAAVGISEEQAKEQHLAYRVGRFLFKANGRAKSLGEEEGMVKVLADAQSDRILGVHIVGPRASEMIAEAVIAMEFKASAEDLARTIHAHPTLSEVVKEAALAVDNRSIHS